MKQLNELLDELNSYKDDINNKKSEVIYAESRLEKVKREIKKAEKFIKISAWKSLYGRVLDILAMVPDHKKIKMVVTTPKIAKEILGEKADNNVKDFVEVSSCNDKNLVGVGECERCNILYAFKLIEKELAKHYVGETKDII